MIEKILVKKNTYRDSLFLMVINSKVRLLSGMEEIAVMRGTDSNKDIMKQVGFSGPEIFSATALVAIMDWFSRYVVAWETSITMEVDFCLEAVENALAMGSPRISNTDQGAQFTSQAFTDMLKKRQIAISMDGRVGAMDNIFTESLWRSLKYEEVYSRDYQSGPEGRQGIDQYFSFYNHESLISLSIIGHRRRSIISKKGGLIK